MVLHSLCRSISLCAILAFSSAILSPMLMTTNVCGFSRVALGYLHGFTRSHAGGYLVTNISPFKNSYDLIGRGIRHLLPNMFPQILLLNWCGSNESAVIKKRNDPLSGSSVDNGSFRQATKGLDQLAGPKTY